MVKRVILVKAVVKDIPPIAIVFALHRAIALWDANGGGGGAKAKFDADDYHNWGQRNFKMFFTYEEGLDNTTSSQV